VGTTEDDNNKIESMAYSYIYALKNKTNGMVYVGQSTVSPHNKLQRFKRLARSDSKRPVAAAVREDGIDGFELIILEECATEELNERECEWMDRLDARNPECGYNMNRGGAWKDRRKISERLSTAMTAVIKRAWADPEKRERIHASQMGAKRKPHTAETKAKISAGRKRWAAQHRAERAA